MAGVDWLEEAFPQRLFINPVDAASRGIQKRRPGPGLQRPRRDPPALPCDPADHAGVVALPQGAWWSPDAAGVDQGGSINVLTSHRWTPLAFGNAQHTIMVEVRKA